MKKALLITLTLSPLLSIGQQTAKQLFLKDNSNVISNTKAPVVTQQASCDYIQLGNNLEDGWGSWYNGNTINGQVADVLDIPANETWVITGSLTRHFMPINETPTEVWVNVFADSTSGGPSFTLVDSMRSSNLNSTFLQQKYSLDVHEIETTFNSGNLVLPGGITGTRYWVVFMTQSTSQSFWEFRYDSNYSDTTIFRHNGTTWSTNNTYVSCAYELEYTIQGGINTDTICYGDSVLFGTTYYDSTGTYNDTLQSIKGCDSLATLELFVSPELNVSLSALQQDTVCLFWDAFALPAGTPAGGTYSGSGVTDSLFTPDSAGVGTHVVYYTYTDSNNCSAVDSVTIQVEACAGISSNELNAQIKVFPNPVKDIVTIQSGVEINSIALYDVLGHLLYTKNINAATTQLDLAAYEKGNYFITINTNKGVVTQQLIK